MKKEVFKALYRKISSKRLRSLLTSFFYVGVKKWQWEDKERSFLRQRKELFKTVDYAIKNIPYYGKIARDIEFEYSQESIFEDYKKWPILTKDIIRENFNDLHNPMFLNESILNSSGGTTGEPVSIYQSLSNLALVSTITRLQYSWGGLGRSDILIQLWGDEEEVFERGKGTDGIIEVSPKRYILNSFRMSDIDMERYRLFINEKKPKFILGYVQSIYEFAKFIDRKNLEISNPQIVMTSAGTLFDEHKTFIEKIFGCKVLNRYGSREVHNIACSCQKQEGLHIDTLFHYFEILDKDLVSVEGEGKVGESYVTLFDNEVMPLLRYKIGDIVTHTNERCSCGRPFPLLKQVNGRNVDMFINSEGENIDGEYFTHLFYFKEMIKKFQVVQLEKDLIEVKVVLMDNSVLNSNNLFRELEDKIKLVMGNNCVVNFKTVKDIPPHSSGKFRYTISEIYNKKNL